MKNNYILLNKSCKKDTHTHTYTTRKNSIVVVFFSNYHFAFFLLLFEGQNLNKQRIKIKK